MLRLPERRAARRLEVEYQGGLAGGDTAILTLAVLKGVFAAGTEEPVSYVNAPQLAEERGLEIREVTTATTRDYVNLITLRSTDHSLAGTLSGPRSEPRIVLVDDHTGRGAAVRAHAGGPQRRPARA